MRHLFLNVGLSLNTSHLLVIERHADDGDAIIKIFSFYLKVRPIMRA